MGNPCSKNVCENTIFCFSLLLFQRILNAFLYDLYHQIAHKLTFPCHNRYIYNTTNTNRVIESFEVHLRTHRDPLSILKTNTDGNIFHHGVLYNLKKTTTKNIIIILQLLSTTDFAFLETRLGVRILEAGKTIFLCNIVLVPIL